MSNIIKFDNNAVGTLSAGITAGATSITMNSGEGALFSTIASPDIAYLTLDDNSGNVEIVQVTTHTAASDNFTVVRAQEGTTGFAFSINDPIEGRLTAGNIDSFLQIDSGGDTKGVGSLNIQASRASGTSVAAGADSIVIGNDTRADTANAIAIGNTAKSRASSVDSIIIGNGSQCDSSTNSVAIGSESDCDTANSSIAIGNLARTNAANAISIGEQSDCNSVDAIILSPGGQCASGSNNAIGIGNAINIVTARTNAIAIGNGAYAAGVDCIAIGRASQSGQDTVAIGRSSYGYGTSDAIVIGRSSFVGAGGSQSIAIGRSAYTNNSASTIAIGYATQNYSVSSVSIGHNTKIGTSSNESLAIGFDAEITSAAGSNAIGRVAHNNVADSTVLSNPLIVRDNGISPSMNSADTRVRYGSAAEIILSTESIDAKTVAATAITLPTNFWVSEVGVVCVEVTGLTTQPAIAFATTAGGTDILAATLATNLDVVGKREHWDEHTITSITVNIAQMTSDIFCRVTTAGAGTSQRIRFYVKGMFMAHSTSG